MESIIWSCPHCKEVRVSFSREPHSMNICKCGKSGMDLEEWYNRVMGGCKELITFNDDDYPFGLELFTCCKEQGFNYWDYPNLERLKEELYITTYYHKD